MKQIDVKEYIVRRLAEVYVQYAENQAPLLPGYEPEMDEDTVAGLVYDFYYNQYSGWHLLDTFSLFNNLVQQGHIPEKELEFISNLPVSITAN